MGDIIFLVIFINNKQVFLFYSIFYLKTILGHLPDATRSYVYTLDILYSVQWPKGGWVGVELFFKFTKGGILIMCM